jgi:hypothetical protein
MKSLYHDLQCCKAQKKVDKPAIRGMMLLYNLGGVMPTTEKETAKQGLCRCGHPQSVHGSIVVNDIRIENAGSCCCLGGCNCQRFHWKGWNHNHVPEACQDCERAKQCLG